MTEPRSIADYHATRESGAGCPEADGGPHYFAFIDPAAQGRVCIDCGEPEPSRRAPIPEFRSEGEDQ